MIAKLILATVATLAASQVQAQTPRIVMEEMMVPSDPGIEIYVRNKRLADMTAFRPERTVLYVHGATYPASTAFDLPLGGLSWMDYLAQRGYDVYLLDIRGYGRSTRPKEMSEKADANPPIVRGDTAVKDIGAVVDFILKRRNIPRLSLIGWSWGTTTMATYTTRNAAKVERLVLYAPGWIRQTASLVPVAPGPLGAWRTATREQALTRWMTGVPEDKKATLIPAGWFDQWADATWATDPEGAKQNPAVIRAPNGVLADGADPADPGRMGPGSAALHGADALPAARQLARQALRAARGRHAHHHHGEEPPRAVQGRAGVPGRAGKVVSSSRRISTRHAPRKRSIQYCRFAA